MAFRRAGLAVIQTVIQVSSRPHSSSCRSSELSNRTAPTSSRASVLAACVALVMAEELIRQGEEVRLLLLCDTYRPTFLRSLGLDLYRLWRRAKHRIGVIAEIIGASNRVRRELVRDIARRKLGGVQSKSSSQLALDFSTDFVRTIYRHRLKRYLGRITLIVSEKQYNSHRSMGWNGVATGGLEVHSTPGDHATRFGLHAEAFAKQVAECLNRGSQGTTH